MPAVEPHVEPIPLRRREQPIVLVEQRKPVQVVASPGREQLRAVPSPVAGARQPFAPDRVGEIEDSIEERTVGNNETICHELAALYCCQSGPRRVYNEGMATTTDLSYPIGQFTPVTPGTGDVRRAAVDDIAALPRHMRNAVK